MRLNYCVFKENDTGVTMDYMLFAKDPLGQGRPIVIDKKLLVKLKKDYTTNHYVMVMVIKASTKK